MSTLQSALDQTLRDAPYQLLTHIVLDRMATQGVKLTAREREQLLNHIRTNADDVFRLRRWRWWENQQLKIELTEADAEAIMDRFTEFIDTQLPELIGSAVEDLSVSILLTLHRNWRAEFRRQDRERRGFEKRLQQRWGEGINLLRMMLTVSRELGEMTRNSITDDPDFASPHLLDVLTRLHARACQVTDEIACLLSSGFADGAMARWRTLHEIAIVALLIQEHGEDLARRYTDHQVVESLRAAKDYRECSQRLGYEPMTEFEFEEIRQAYEEVVQRYGDTFKTQYGWAADALGHRQPSLKEIERVAGIDHLRAHYRLASHNIHANPKGVFFKLGLFEEVDVLLAGPSNAGLADPGHNAAISLLHVSVAQGLIRPNLDSLVGLRILSRLTAEVGEAFHRAHRQLEEEAG